MKKYSILFLCILFSFDGSFARSGRLGELFSHYRCELCFVPLETQDILIALIEEALGKEPRYLCQKCIEKNKIGGPNSPEPDIMPASPVPQPSGNNLLERHYDYADSCDDGFKELLSPEKLKPKTMRMNGSGHDRTLMNGSGHDRTLWQRVKGLFRGTSGQKVEDKDEEPTNPIFFKKYTKGDQSMLVIGQQGANRFFVIFPQDKESSDSVGYALKEKRKRKIVKFPLGETLDSIEFPESNDDDIIFHTKENKASLQLQAGSVFGEGLMPASSLDLDMPSSMDQLENSGSSEPSKPSATFCKKYTKDGMSMVVVGNEGAKYFSVILSQDEESGAEGGGEQKRTREIITFPLKGPLECIEFPEDGKRIAFRITEPVSVGSVHPQVLFDAARAHQEVSREEPLFFIYGKEGEDRLVCAKVNGNVLNVRNIENEFEPKPQTKKIKLPPGLFIRSFIRLPEHAGVVVVTNGKPLLLRPRKYYLEEYKEKVSEPEYAEIPDDDERSTSVFFPSLPGIPLQEAPELPFRRLPPGEKPPNYLEGEEPFYEECTPLDPLEKQVDSLEKQGTIRRKPVEPIEPITVRVGDLLHTTV